MKKFGKKGAAVIVLVLVIAAGVFGYQRYEAAQAAEAAKVLSLSGNVDVREVSLAFRGSDRIAEILVDEGDTVKKGQVLARLDGRELELSIAKTQADIRSQQSTVEKLHNGTRSEEIAQAQQNYEQAQAAAANAQGTYARYQAIYDDIQGISRQTLDTARHDAEAKQAAAARRRALTKKPSTAHVLKTSRSARQTSMPRIRSSCGSNTSCPSTNSAHQPMA